ncbi:hypothetical protein HMI55_003971, partial [Coelomomyces lativittatus]
MMMIIIFFFFLILFSNFFIQENLSNSSSTFSFGISLHSPPQTLSNTMLSTWFSFFFMVVPTSVFQLLSKIVSLSWVLTFDYKGIITLVALISGGVYFLVHRYYLTIYSRLPQPALHSSSQANGHISYDLHPDVVTSLHDSTSFFFSSTYAEEFLGSFLQSIKVFGYMEQNVFHELARRLQ